MITLALVIGALEARTPKDAWRQTTNGWGHYVGSGDLLRWLSDNGYPLAPVEEVTDKLTADAVYTDTLGDGTGDDAEDDGEDAADE